MSTWNYNKPANPVNFDFNADFDSEVKNMKTNKGGHMVVGSHTYYVLRALFEGNTIDDYENPPLNAIGLPVRNVRSRIASLRIEWNVTIGDRVKDGKTYKEYCIYGREA